jgi:peptide/nickel transport system ATP-binding protein
VDDVSFHVTRGEVLGVVGESGSGKTTVGRAVLRLIKPSSGRVLFAGTDITALSGRKLRSYRRRMQIIFQNPFASLDPRHSVESIICEALRTHDVVPRRQQRDRVAELLGKVGLSADAMRRYPHEFSGGQRQRIGIARALAVEPEFIVADEPVSALDVSIQAQVVNLIQDLQEELGLSVLFISHDLAVVEHICDRVMVMYLGRIMEIAPSRDLHASPRHPYTESLLAAAPVPDPTLRMQRILLQGDIPSPQAPPSGCVFRTRCRYAIKACAATVPELREVAPGRSKASIRDDIL